MGSPPRVRGKLSTMEVIAGKLRITPACAGKTSSLPILTWVDKDHPRVCGENIWRTEARSGKKGSPPRVRGKQEARTMNWENARITPACAGKTFESICSLFGNKDHPRVCGENWCLPSRDFRTRGSPPRVRGKRCCQPKSKKSCRITPACAGKTWHFPA